MIFMKKENGEGGHCSSERARPARYSTEDLLEAEQEEVSGYNDTHMYLSLILFAVLRSPGWVSARQVLCPELHPAHTHSSDVHWL